MRNARASALVIPIATAILYSVLFFAIEHSRWNPLRASNYGWKQSTLDTISGGGVKRPIAFLVIGISGLFFLTRRKRSDFVIHKAASVVVISYLAWSWLSFFWADDPHLVLKRIISFTLLFLAAFALSRAVSRGDFLLIIWGTTSLFLGIGVVSEWKLATLHLFSSGSRFMGTLYPEGQGFNCGMLFLSSMALATETTSWARLAYRLVAVIALVFLFLTGARGPFAGVLFASAVYVLFTRKRSTINRIVYFTLLALSVSVLLFGSSQVAGVALLGREEQVSSLSGRIPLWIECLNSVEKRPLIGYGFGGFWTEERAWVFTDSLDWIINSSHSIYLETALNLGVVGLVLLFAMFLSAWRIGARSVKNDPNYVTAFFLSTLVLMCADGLLSTLVVGGGFVTFVLLCVIFYLCFSTSIPVRRSTVVGSVGP